MSKESFNLVEQPWIPCVTASGVITSLGLLDALCRAHHFREIWDSSPLVIVSLYRLLLPILHRVFGPANADAWAQLWQHGNGTFDNSKLENYLRSPAVNTRFDLFDEKHPFFQTASLPLGPIDRTSGRPRFVKPIWQLAHALAYSDNMNLFSHYVEGNWEVRPTAEAARWLVAFQSFALGGRITTEEGKRAQDGSADAGQLVKSAVVLVRGDNLFQTLMLNLVRYNAEAGEPFAFQAAADKPAWEREGETTSADRSYDGYLDLLTWQSRRVKLIPERSPDGSILGISGVVAMKGFQLPERLRRQRETMVCFGKNENAHSGQDPWPPLGFRSGKAMWRNCHLFLQSIANKNERPATLRWIAALRTSGILYQQQLCLEISGLCSDRSKIFCWRHESLQLPLACLTNTSLLKKLSSALGLAEQVGALLTTAVRRSAVTLKPGKDEKTLGNKDRAVIERLAHSFGCERLYWSRLEEPFRRLIRDSACGLALKAASANPQAANDGLVHASADWCSKVCREAVEVYRETVGGLAGSSRTLRALVIGENILLESLDAIQRLQTEPARAEIAR